MFYNATIPQNELAILGELIGLNLDAVFHDGWSAHLQFGDRVLGVLPEEESTPDPEHPTADIDRPKITIADTDLSKSRMISDGRVGTIQGINIISLLIRFSEVESVPEQMYGKIRFPAGAAYRPIYLTPSRMEEIKAQTPEGNALVFFDKAIQVVTDNLKNIILYTKGYFINVSMSGFPDESWMAPDFFTCRSISPRESAARSARTAA